MSLTDVTPIRAARPAAPARTSTLVSWQAGIVSLVLLIWLIPIKRYALPVNLPFKLEPYRLTILLLLILLLVGIVLGRERISAAGHGKPIILLAIAALGSQLANAATISANGQQTQSVKSLSYFISFLVAFALVTSTLRYFHEIDLVIRVLVVGGALVAIAALVESKTHYNVFNHLNRWFPFLHATGEDKYNVRGGRLRVRASAQHPIALAAALLITAPLALYAAQHALSKARSRIWLCAGLLLIAGAFATVSRTAVAISLAMTVTALILRPREVVRRWWVIPVLFVFIHFAAPGSISHLWKAFFPKNGLLAQQSIRSNQRGSGRLADLGPGVKLWSQKPVFGRGLGTGGTAAEPTALQGTTDVHVRVIYDDQYLTSLITIGGAGFAGMIWLLWGAVAKLGKAARRTVGRASNLFVACTVSAVGFATGMLTYDAFSFVQVSLLFYVIIALGLRARTLLLR